MIHISLAKILLSFVVAFFFLSNSSCDETHVIIDEKPNSFGTVHIEGIMSKNVFQADTVAYCKHLNDEKPEKGLKAVDDLKVRIYNWNEKLRFETDIYYKDEGSQTGGQNQKKVIFFGPRFLDSGQFIEIVRLNNKGEIIQVLGKIQAKGFPETGYSHTCKKISLSPKGE